MKRFWQAILAVACVCVSANRPANVQAGATPSDPNIVYDPALYQALRYRPIGPARGGRVTAVAGVPGQIHAFYMGAAGGGVWKTTDAGETWENISDGFFEVGSIGAVAVADADPNIIYVGTGSACMRGNVSPGIGVYRSADGGRTWTHVGLRESGQIARVRIHPTDPNLVYVAANGHGFGPNPERGIFRSRDGGRSWQKVLFINDQTGAVDLAMDPKDPRILYAAMAREERKPWVMISGGPDGGIFKTIDGGDTWTKLTNGLPNGLLGRIGVAVSPPNTNRLWAIVESETDPGLYISEDAGQSWRLINTDHELQQRPFYYHHVYADPRDPNVVYELNTRLYKSTDGGRTFKALQQPHGDNHDLWLNPNDPRIMINGHDGGATVSLTGGLTWSTMHNQPTAEMYRVSLDNQFVYRVYGAQQDNSTISVPSRVTFGITPTQHWYAVAGGESGHIAVDPRNPNIVYAGHYRGEIYRYDHATGLARAIRPYPEDIWGQAPRDVRYRFQWHAPVRLSPHNPEILYFTSQYVHRSTNEGQSWQVISPDLTRNDKSKQGYGGVPITAEGTGVEVYDTIFAFEESPTEPGVLWAGSDDGLVHVSRDNGKTWQNVTPPGLPEWGTVNTIEISRHAPGRVFVAVMNYRMDDFKPYVYRTDDYGQTWERLTDGANGIPANHFVRVVREDPDRKGLLFAGTEFGMYVSFDDGRHWQTLQLNLPVTAITDIAVYRKDLVVATQGRSFWILDDIAPLQQITQNVATTSAHLFAPRETYRMQLGSRGGGPGARSAENPPEGALIYFTLASAPAGEVAIDVLDAAGRTVRRYRNVEARAGMNRFVWDLRYPGPNVLKEAVMRYDMRGPEVVPGAYQVRLTVAGQAQTAPLAVRKDPRIAATAEDLTAQLDLMLQVRDKITEAHDAIRTSREVKQEMGEAASKAKAAGDAAGARQADTARQKLQAIEEELIQVKAISHQDPIRFPPKLDFQFAGLYYVVGSTDARPTDASYERLKELTPVLAGHVQRLKAVIDTDVAAVRAATRKRGTGAAPEVFV